MATDADRLELHKLAHLLIAHRKQMDYPINDVRGYADAATFRLSREEAEARVADGDHLMFDCSGAITCLFKWAGLKDPNGLGYRHEGFTGTMLAELPHYTNPSGANIGAIVIFGPGTGKHVAMVIEPGHDPLLFSHGERGFCGPILLSDERRFHPPPVTMLSIAHL